MAPSQLLPSTVSLLYALMILAISESAVFACFIQSLPSFRLLFQSLPIASEITGLPRDNFEVHEISKAQLKVHKRS